MPITDESLKNTLSVPSEKEIRIKASKIHHPILKPVSFNLKDGLSVDEASILAVIQNPILKAERDRRNIAYAELIQAGILPNPKISCSFETPVGGNTEEKVNAYGIDLNWEITSLITRGARRSSYKFKARSIDLDIAWKEWQVAEAAKLAVYRVIISEKKFSLRKKIWLLYKRLLSEVEKGVKLGIITKSELFSVRQKFHDARAELIQSKADLRDSWLDLKRILGVPANMDLVLEKRIKLMKVRNIPKPQELTDGLDKRRLDLVALRYGYKSQDERLREAILAQFPKINLAFIAQQDTDGVKTIGFGISLSLPIFNRNQGKIAIEKATRKRLFDEYAARLFEAVSRIYKLTERLSFDLKKLDFINKYIEELEKTSKLYHLAFQAGRANLFDYYDTMIQLSKKRLEKINLQGDILSILIGLEIASGRYLF